MEENMNVFELSTDEMEQVSGGKDAVSVKKGAKVIAKKAGAKVLTGPGKDFAEVAQTTAGAIATYTGELKFVDGEPWIRVTWNSKSGWIKASNVKLA